MDFRQSFKPISISLSPNTEKDDVWLAFRLIFQPWLWKKGRDIEMLQEEFKKYSGLKYAFAFNSGRSSLLAILDALGLQKGDEILLQAFTCNAVPNPAIWSGLKPVYVDCDEQTFNIDVEDLKRKIGPKSRVVIVQHTFGLVADMDKILKICRQNNLIIIEDCAHALGATYYTSETGLPAVVPLQGGTKAGSFGRVSFFSFSRDKVISSVYGGMVATNDSELAAKIRKAQEKFGYPSYFWILQQLLHPVLMNWLILPTYRFLGKYLLVVFQWLHVFSKAVYWKEKQGKKPGYFPKRFPNSLAILALNQFKKLERFNEHRREIAAIYAGELSDTKYEIPDTKYASGHIFLRFVVKHRGARKIIENSWKNNLLIGDWYTSPIAPLDTQLDKMHYNMGSCPKAEKLAKMTLNLPTHINVSKEDAKKVVEFLKTYGS